MVFNRTRFFNKKLNDVSYFFCHLKFKHTSFDGSKEGDFIMARKQMTMRMATKKTFEEGAVGLVISMGFYLKFLIL